MNFNKFVNIILIPPLGSGHMALACHVYLKFINLL
jgi:hypothetical protein